ncbi:hypothetical protein [Acinetobacter chinensis]|uniref:hypothetical protein n=1 Tax=Acinetobacter chinensis TaxID=2004650 RepID=UPI002934C758|nr:hypothetical protein [Acinetobacter chinensis]WOE40063.1 hypothetical protein QSG87_09065 [Acinetobacter chinensis]
MDEFTPDTMRKQLQDALKNGKLRREYQSRQSSDRKQRDQADRETDIDEFGRKIPRPRFLRPEHIAQGEKYDVERVLYTTLGIKEGEAPRKITRADIMAFKDNIDLLRDQYTTGITIQNVINLSHADDIQRSNEQIRLVSALSRKDSLVHFMTNAGPRSKAKFRNVEVEFSSFNSLISSTAESAINLVRHRLIAGKIKFECDCERHTYWYRYMATIGGYGLGRMENGYPKLRNPLLTGVACKHVLSVLNWIQSPSGVTYLKTEVDRDRKKQRSVRQSKTTKQIETDLNRQLSEIEKGTAKTIKADVKKAEKEMLRRADKVQKEYFRELRKAEQKNISNETKQARDRVKAQTNSIIKSLSADQLAALEKYLSSFK